MNATLNKVDSRRDPERSPRNLHLASISPFAVDPESRFLVAVTGASGVEYARRLIELLGDRTDVIVTKDASAVIEVETGLSTKEFTARARTFYRGEDQAAPP